MPYRCENPMRTGDEKGRRACAYWRERDIVSLPVQTKRSSNTAGCISAGRAHRLWIGIAVLVLKYCL